MVHKDCFAYHKSKAGSESCRALKVMECYKCKFYKTENPQAVSMCKNHRTTPYEKEQIIKLFNSGKTRKQIADTEGIGVSYEMICKIIKNYRRSREE